MAQAEVHGLRPEIAVKAKVEVAEKATVRLIDIANINFVNPEQQKQAYDIAVFDAPAEGKTTIFQNSELVKIVRDHINQNAELNSLKWTYFVPEKVEVTGKGILLSPLSAENQIEMAILAKCTDCKVNIRDLHIPTAKMADALKNCQIQTDNLKPGGAFLLPVQCESQGQAKTFWISGTAKVSKTAPISLRQISPGDRLTDKDFHMGDVDLTYARDGVASEAEVVGKAAAKMIQLNQPIFKNDLKRELAVARGQMIRVVMGDDSFEVSSSAVAEEQGYIGDMVRVKNADSQKVMSGVVTDKGVVKLQ